MTEQHAPDEPPPGSGPPSEPPPHGRGRLVLLVAAGALVVVAGVVVAVVALTRPRGDEADIRALVDRFALAVDREDQAAVVALLCAQEAADITEDDDYDPANDGGLATQPPHRDVRTSQVQVTGDVASARVERPEQDATTLWFRKEDGVWTVCAYAQEDATGTATAAG